ncbi:hypothetical protein BDR03DRAFT_1001692 [Suillus americanus]|nr:hypothetical protein BDR03DRAFT_1001692 [Suillus americanus]
MAEFIPLLPIRTPGNKLAISGDKNLLTTNRTTLWHSRTRTRNSDDELGAPPKPQLNLQLGLLMKWWEDLWGSHSGMGSVSEVLRRAEDNAKLCAVAIRPGAWCRGSRDAGWGTSGGRGVTGQLPIFTARHALVRRCWFRDTPNTGAVESAHYIFALCPAFAAIRLATRSHNAALRRDLQAGEATPARNDSG